MTVLPTTGDGFGITLHEIHRSGSASASVPVLTATQPQVARILDVVLTTVRQSGHQPGILAVELGRSIPIEEAAGIRLALTLFASAPISRHDRVRAMVAGIAAMSLEETYYWYAKCAGFEAPRGRRALRVLLADDKPTSS